MYNLYILCSYNVPLVAPYPTTLKKTKVAFKEGWRKPYNLSILMVCSVYCGINNKKGEIKCTGKLCCVCTRSVQHGRLSLHLYYVQHYFFFISFYFCSHCYNTIFMSTTILDQCAFWYNI